MAPEEASLSKCGDKKYVDIANGGVGSQPKPKRSNGLSIKFIVFALLALGIYLWRRSSITPIMVNYVSDEGDIIMDFDDITPNEKLEWHSCFHLFKCARLTVPMDYNRPLNESKDNPKVHIAMILVPGRNHTSTGEYSVSPVLINPGGPGGSGVQVVRGVGFGIQEIIDPKQDVIGFDPRGVGSTTPLTDCYSFPYSDGAEPSKDDIARGFFHRFTYAVGGLNVGVVNSNAGSLLAIDSRARAVAKLCKYKDDMYGKDSILKHVGTPSVARDMLSIVDAWDAWRDGLQEIESGTQVADQSDAKMTEDTGLDTKGKLVYWGFSYGTLLGATFASMFPDRVGRVILDGVVDADYYVGPSWVESLLDTDAVQESFFKYCHRAKEACDFYRTGDSVAGLKARLGSINRRLEESPITGVDPLARTPAVITSYMIKQAFFVALYFPIQGFPLIANIFDALDRGNDELILSLFTLPTAVDSSMFCDPYISPRYNLQDSLLAIMCGDKRYPLNETIPNLLSLYETIANISDFADIWTTIMLGCDGWAIESTDPPMQWDDHPAHKPKPIKTSYPLLFISNTADPVTPLKAGVKMARKFVGAGLIEQKSEGHCSLSAASGCTIQKIKDYLKEGKVPSPPEWGPEGREIEEGKWERCECDEWPWAAFDAERWLDSQLATKQAQGMSVEQVIQEARQLQAWRRTREQARDMMNFFGNRMLHVFPAARVYENR